LGILKANYFHGRNIGPNQVFILHLLDNAKLNEQTSFFKMTTMSDVTVAMKSTINSNLCSKMMHPPHSFKNSNASPKVKITKKKERVGVRSLARSTAREEGHDGAPKWGLG
jgi:hypothetical protein